MSRPRPRPGASARDAARRRLPRRLAAVVLAIAALVAVAGRLAAQSGALSLSGPVEGALARVQEQWLQWIGAFYQDDERRAGKSLEDLSATVQQLGMERLPDLSLGAATRAVQSARDGNVSRATWALAAAERFDAGRPETSFAAATASWTHGAYLRAIGEHLTGWRRVFGIPLVAQVWWHDALLWAIAALLLAGILFVGIEMAVHGPALLADIVTLGRFLPPGVALAIAVVVLLWPLVLPAGPAWLGLYWSALLWAYGSWSERGVLVAGWAVVAVLPLVAMAQQGPIDVALSPAMRATRAAVSGRLYGAIFTDLGVLRTRLPESAAVSQLLGDFNRRLGQWEQARTLYAEVVEKEPSNVPALLDLGAYYFRRNDFGNAVSYFQRATTADAGSAAAFYNLSLAFSESYLFDDSTRALQQAQQIDNNKVSQWIQRSEDARVLTYDGGYARVDEIAAQLAAPRGGGRAERKLGQLRGWVSVGIGVASLLLALGWTAVRRQLGDHAAASDPEELDSTVAKIALPGYVSATGGRGVHAYLALLVPAALVLLPFVRSIGYALPLGWAPGRVLAVAIAAIGLLLVVAVRVKLALDGGED